VEEWNYFVPVLDLTHQIWLVHQEPSKVPRH